MAGKRKGATRVGGQAVRIKRVSHETPQPTITQVEPLHVEKVTEAAAKIAEETGAGIVITQGSQQDEWSSEEWMGAKPPEDEGDDDMAHAPIHRASVLGAVLYQCGFDPSKDGEFVLGEAMQGSWRPLSRILLGKRPTPVRALKALAPYVDALQRNPAYLGRRGVEEPFLCAARDWLKDEANVRMRAIGNADPSFLVHSSAVEAMRSLTGFADCFDDLADRRGNSAGVGDKHINVWPRDVSSMWGACCRVVCWSPADVAELFDLSLSQARLMAEGQKMPTTDMWRKLFRRYDEELDDTTSAVGVAIRWSRADQRPNQSFETREEIEWDYCAGDAFPIMLSDNASD